MTTLLTGRHMRILSEVQRADKSPDKDDERHAGARGQGVQDALRLETEAGHQLSRAVPPEDHQHGQHDQEGEIRVAEV